MFGGTITGTSAYSLDAPYSAGGSATQITLTFTASVSDPVIAWAGHVASQDNWGAGHAAADIPGSPYHMRLLDLDSTGGKLSLGGLGGGMMLAGTLAIAGWRRRERNK